MKLLSLLSAAFMASVLTGCVNPEGPVGLPKDAQATAMDADVVVIDNSGAAFAIYDDGFDLDMANADIWQRIRAGFNMPDIQTDVVTQKEQWYQARPQYFELTCKRARRYLYYIVEEVQARGMPMELALIPFLESAFNPEAVSTAQAAGMWQFIPSTGRNFELQQDIFRDERRDVMASTTAALDYLQKLYGMFGDWHLALAAYNWGEGNVLRAIESNKRQGKPTDYLSLKLPNETRGYVPTLQALKNVVADPLSFKMELPLIADHPFFQAVAIEKDMDVDVIIALAKISKEEFKALNPAANKPVILAAITPQILLPWDNAEGFIERLSLYRGQLSTWTVWKAPQTMTAAQVASSVNMPEKILREVNEIPPAMLVKQGSTLLVHRRQGQGSAANVTLKQVQNASVDFAHSSGRRSTPSKIAVAPQGQASTASSAAGRANASRAGASSAGASSARNGNGGAGKPTATTALRNSTPSKVAAR